MNALIEQSSKTYHERMERWVDIALEEGVRFFVTSLGNPRWVVERVAAARRRRLPRRDRARSGPRRDWTAGVDGLIAVNDRAGGHAGPRSSAEQLLDELAPVRRAGGVRGRHRRRARFRRVPCELGYAGVQLGTRFIATHRVPRERGLQARDRRGRSEATSCSPSGITGVPVAVIDTPYVRRTGLEGGAARALDAARPPHQALDAHDLRAALALAAEARPAARLRAERDFWQAGKSVAGIDAIEPAGEIVRRFGAAARVLDEAAAHSRTGSRGGAVQRD